MKRVKFILAVESFIIRKGLSSVLNNIQGILFIRETDNTASLEQILKNQVTDFIIICDSLFNGSERLYIENAELLEKTILVCKEHVQVAGREVKDVIYLDESKEELIQKFENLLTPYFKNLKDPRNLELSDREKTIVRYVATGMTNKEIADKLFLSAHTVITHRKNISRKLNIKSASGLTVYAIVNNIISIDEISGLNPAAGEL